MNSWVHYIRSARQSQCAGGHPNRGFGSQPSLVRRRLAQWQEARGRRGPGADPRAPGHAPRVV